MLQSEQRGKRYWLRGGLIVVAVQVVLFITYGFVVLWAFSCLDSDVCYIFTHQRSNELLGFIANAVDPFHIVRLLWDLPLPDAVILVIDLLIIPIHLAIGFSIGAAIGSWYGDRVKHRLQKELNSS